MEELMEALRNYGSFTILGDMYFLNITDKGSLVFELLKLWREEQQEGIKQVEQARFEEQRKIAKSLLNTIGINIDNLTENED